MRTTMKDSDEWETPKALFDQLNNRFNFRWDCCCTVENCKVQTQIRWIGHGYNYLKYGFDNMLSTDSWLFLNPPYSKPAKFIKKAYKESRSWPIVCLLKCDTSTKWWGIFYDYEKQKPRPGVTIEYFPKRLKFERNGIPSSSANFPSCLVILDRRDI